MKSEKDLSKQYQKKSDKQHVLDNPDTYIGSIEQVDTIQYIYNDEDNKINLKDINLIPPHTSFLNALHYQYAADQKHFDCQAHLT